MKKTAEIQLSGKDVIFEITQGFKANRLEIYIKKFGAGEKTPLTSFVFDENGVRAHPYQGKEEFVINEGEKLKELLQAQLSESVYDRYQAVLNQPKLKSVQCSVVIRQDDFEYETLYEGLMEECLIKALSDTKEYKALEVWLPIGEDDVYVFASFYWNDEEDKLIQTTCLPKRIIELASEGFKANDEYEQQLIETGEFVNEEIIEPIEYLSTKTYIERCREDGLYTVFEEIAVLITQYGSAQAAYETFVETEEDLNTHRNRLILKALMHFVVEETN